jgi:hypothetical protein
MYDVGVGCILEDGRVEVPVMAVNKLADAARLHVHQLLRFVLSAVDEKNYSVPLKD